MTFDAWSWLILAGTILFTASLMPQLMRTLQLRRAEHISATFTVLVILASFCNLIYFFHREEWIAGSGFIANIIVWSIVLYFRMWPQPERGRQPKH